MFCLFVFLLQSVSQAIQIRFKFKFIIFFTLQTNSMLQQKIHPIHNSKYPFGQQKECQKTFACFDYQIQNDFQLQEFQRNIGLITDFNNENVIGLVKISKKQKSCTLFYRYYSVSFRTWAKKNIHLIDVISERTKILAVISEVISQLLEKGVQSPISIQQMGFSRINCLKIFINPKIQIAQDLQLLKIYYQNIKNSIGQSITQIFNQQKKTSNLSFLFKQKPIKVVPRNFTIRGNNLVFMYQKKQNQYLRLSLHDNLIQKNRQSTSIVNTATFNNLDNMQSKEDLNIKKIDNKCKWNRRTSKVNKSVQTLKTLHFQNKQNQIQNQNFKKRSTNLKITSYSEIQIFEKTPQRQYEKNPSNYVLQKFSTIKTGQIGKL